MHLCEGHRLGILTLLIVTITVYWVSALSARLPSGESTLPWGNQEPGMIAVEIAGEPTGEGIYFLPKGMKLHELPQSILSGMKSSMDKRETENEISAHGSPVTISIDGGMLKVTGMPAAKRLALGLPVDLNFASEEELALIPGIGGKTAFKIAMLREQKGRFRLIEDLLEVPGIGLKKLDEIKKFLTLERTIH